MVTGHRFNYTLLQDRKTTASPRKGEQSLRRTLLTQKKKKDRLRRYSGRTALLPLRSL